MPVVTSGDSSITFSQGKSFRSLAQQKKIFVDFEVEFNKDVTSAQIGFSGYKTGDGNLDHVYNPLSLTEFSFDFSGKKIFDPNGQFVFSYSPDASVRLQATINPTGYDYYLDGIGIASNMAKDDFVISDFFVDVTGNSNAQLKIKNFTIDGDIKHTFSTVSPRLISYDKPDIPIAISGSSVQKYNKVSNTFLNTVEPYYSSMFETKTNGVTWSTAITGVGFKSDSIENYSNLLSGLHGTGIQYTGVIYNNETASDEVLEEKFNIILNSNHGSYFIPTNIVEVNSYTDSVAEYINISEPASLKTNEIFSTNYKNYIQKGDDPSPPPSAINAPSQNNPNPIPTTQTIHLSSPEGYLLDFFVEQVGAEDGGIITEAHIDKIATNEYNVVHRLIPLDSDRQLSDPLLEYKFPFSYAFISGDGNEGQYRPLKGVAFGDADNKYTSRFDENGEVNDTEYTLSREGEFRFIDGNIGLGNPITRGNVAAGDPLAGFEIIFTGAAEATGIGILGASAPSVTPIYGDTTTQVVNVDEIANILITNVGENIDTFSPLIVGDIQGSVGVGITYDGMHPKVTGAAVIYNATGYTKSVYDWALFSGDVNERGFSELPWIDTDAKREHPKEIDETKASYLNSFTNTYLTNGESLHFRLKNKFYADTDESKVTLVFSGIPTGDDIVVKALNEKGEEKEVYLGKVRISEDSQLRDHTIYDVGDETKVIEVEVTGGASMGADGQSILQDHTRIKENTSLQVSGDSLDYFTLYPETVISGETLHYYNANTIGNTIPWDPKYADSLHFTPRRII